MMQQFGYAIQFGETLQAGGWTLEGQRGATFKCGTTPCDQGRDGSRINRRQLREIDFRLSALYCGQPRIQCGLGIIDSQRESRSEHVDYLERFGALAALAASLAFLSAKALIKPSIPPLLISAAKLPL